MAGAAAAVLLGVPTVIVGGTLAAVGIIGTSLLGANLIADGIDWANGRITSEQFADIIAYNVGSVVGASVVGYGSYRAAKWYGQSKAPSNPAGTYRPSAPLRRGPNGEMLPSSPYPHTQLGTEMGRKVGPYTAAREFGPNGQPIRDIHFTDHGRPSVPGHTNPHQHPHIPNPTGGTPKYGDAEPFIP